MEQIDDLALADIAISPRRKRTTSPEVRGNFQVVFEKVWVPKAVELISDEQYKALNKADREYVFSNFRMAKKEASELCKEVRNKILATSYDIRDTDPYKLKIQEDFL